MKGICSLNPEAVEVESDRRGCSHYYNRMAARGCFPSSDYSCVGCRWFDKKEDMSEYCT